MPQRHYAPDEAHQVESDWSQFKPPLSTGRNNLVQQIPFPRLISLCAPHAHSSRRVACDIAGTSLKVKRAVYRRVIPHSPES